MFVKRGDSKILSVVNEKDVSKNHKKLAEELVETLFSEEKDKKEEKSSNKK